MKDKRLSPGSKDLHCILCSFSTIFCFCFLCSFSVFGQSERKISGTISDATTGETLIGATVLIKGTSQGTTTDIQGEFTLNVTVEPPVTLVVNYIGYVLQEVVVSDFTQKVKVRLNPDNVMMKEVEVVGKRISEKQQQEPLTVETMDIIAIKEAPTGNFYEGLGTLKGVDLTTASMGFKVINTRGFNSTSPVRSLQLIDGVDNQSPGLNFSLGNFLGAPDLDIMKVEVIAGASSAFYGPGAFNGVISMTSKNPFLFKGLNAIVKVGERNMKEVGVRWADAIKNKEGVDKFAYKINFNFLSANDWEADNYDPIYGSDVPASNPGRYDAINIYGDEGFNAANNTYSSPVDKLSYPGLGTFYRSGYKEPDLVDYNLENLKFNTSFHYRFLPDLEASYQFSYANGNTVYQGDNRYRLDDIRFYQNKIEFSGKDKWFIRAYATHEDAGKTYDVVQTAFLLNEATRPDDVWNTAYRTRWNVLGYRNMVQSLPGFPTFNLQTHGSLENWAQNYYDPFIAMHQDIISGWHAELLQIVDQQQSSILDPRYDPGTPRFDSLFQDIISRDFSQGGSRFYDESALYHVHGEYKLTLGEAILTVGANGRLYTPKTNGTIFRDTLQYERRINEHGEVIITDSSYASITNYQYGAYAGIDREYLEDRLKVNLTVRMDKNENFDYLFSPALSLVYALNVNHTFRTTFTSAVRNPTLADQYLYYNVGRAILLGNIDGVYAEGRDSLIIPESFTTYRNAPSLAQGIANLEYFHVDAITPEKVKTFEAGYRGTWFNRIYFDLSAYYSIYNDFIGYVIGIDANFDPATGFPVGGIQPYRLAANAKEKVTTQGASAGINYYYKKLIFSGNYSYNKLTSGDEDPIIPAFNTPQHKYNIGLSGRELRLLRKNNWGFNVNYKWIDGFIFEGSPQFTGFINSYGMVDAQINYTIKMKNDMSCQLKLGASNLLNNRVFQVYGGPVVGRLAFFAVTYDWNRK